MSWFKVQLSSNEYVKPGGERFRVDQIELWGYGMVFYRDINKDPNAANLAKRIAKDLSVPFYDCRRDSNQEATP